ncbi:Pentatricopeptide repeat-containing protein [Dichanthelium oligosanthes]|uniref:Pentatricopeptide repeat-containing protein n=1 Tax=Dichanthelium oligosanthes TaxID=888268 RepID=A0A1E5W501_9POAL|nr:Pentatricopeptide repeat-containing protein [Dichanthelium oligosanthes]
MYGITGSRLVASLQNRARSASRLLCSSAESATRVLSTDAPGVFDEIPPLPPTSPALPRRALVAHAHQVLAGMRLLGFCTAARHSADDHSGAEPSRFTVVPGDNAVDGLGAGVGVGVLETAERVCRVVSTQPEPRIASALDALGVAVSPELVAEVLKNLSNAGMLALAFFRWAERQERFRYTAESFHNLIEALGKIKQFRLVWSLVETMRCRGLLSKDTFKLIVRRYARARKVKEAVETFEKMSNFGLKTELSDYNWLIDTLSKSKQVKKGHAIYKEMKRKGRFVPDLKTYTVLMEGWGHEKDLLMVKTVHQEMLDAGIRPDVVAYGMLISAFCKSGKCDEAIKVFREMEVSGCMPSPHVYCMLINGLGSEERLDEALKYFELYKESGFPMEVPTCNAVVGAYCRASKFQHAFKMVDEMRACKIGPNSRTYDIILHHLIKSQKFEEAYDVFQRMGMDGSEPQLNTYTMMVGMFCSNERVDMALKAVAFEDLGRQILTCGERFRRSSYVIWFCALSFELWTTAAAAMCCLPLELVPAGSLVLFLSSLMVSVSSITSYKSKLPKASAYV